MARKAQEVPRGQKREIRMVRKDRPGNPRKTSDNRLLQMRLPRMGPRNETQPGPRPYQKENRLPRCRTERIQIILHPPARNRPHRSGESGLLERSAEIAGRTQCNRVGIQDTERTRSADQTESQRRIRQLHQRKGRARPEARIKRNPKRTSKAFQKLATDSALEKSRPEMRG